MSPELQALLASLPEAPAEILPEAYRGRALYNRQEKILVGPRRAGKSTVAKLAQSGPLFPSSPTNEQYLGVIDDTDGDPVRLHKLIVAANRFQRNNKWQFPRYRWVALVRDTTWVELRKRVYFLGNYVVGQFGFHPDDYWYWLPPAAREQLGHEWRDWFKDAQGRFMPELAYLGARKLGVTGSILEARRQACAEWFSKQDDLKAQLAWIVPDQMAFKRSRIIIPRKYALSRLQSFSRQVVPLGQIKAFCERCEIAGVWATRREGYYTWAAPYAYGAAIVKRSLTADRLREMLGAGG